MPRHSWRRAAVAVAAAAAALLLPSQAMAANDISMTGGVVTINSDVGQSDTIYLQSENNHSVLIRTVGSQYSTVTAPCNFVDIEFGFYRRFRCDDGATTITKVIANTGDQSDQVSSYSGALQFGMEVHGGDDADYLYGDAQADQLFGDAGNDNIYGNGGNDTLDGGGDGDFLQGNEGADDFTGGDGFDTAAYYDRGPGQGVTLSLDDAANDGEPGEGDNVRSSVEDLIGGDGNDVMTGSALPNQLDGGAGNDIIDGTGGTDRYTGGAGNDTILSRDGNSERVDCGENFDNTDDADVAKSDTVDEVTNCEDNQASSSLQADQDGDGFQSPTDCNDLDKAIHPGATDTPDDGIDQDCDAKDAQNLDKDKDGFTKDLDCDDTNAAVKPGATEIVGNEVDENCDGFAPPTPVLETPIFQNFDFHKGITKVLTLGAGEMPAGTTLTMRCSGGKKFGCPTKQIKKTFAKASKGYSFFKKFKRSKLRKGATIDIEITKPGFVGRFVRFKIKPKATPTPQVLCIFPGDTKAKAC
jgi:hypothetical protein